MCSEESKHDSDLDEPWIMTVKGLHANNKPSLFETAFSNGSSNSSSPSRDVNLNHLKIVNPAQRSPSHNQGFSPSSSPTREVPESPTQKSSMKEDRYVIESTTETSKNDEFLLKSPEKEFERLTLKDVSFERRKSQEVSKQNSSQTRENDNKEEVTNGRTAINIPGDLPSPKAKSPPVVVEKRNSLRNSEQQQQQALPQKEHREHHRDHHHNGAKVSNHHNNNKTNSACLNNLILPLLSDVSRKKKNC